MTYTGTYRAAQATQKSVAIHKTQARQKSQYRRIRAAIRTVSGWTTAAMLFLVLGKAGASDCGATIEEIFPSVFIYMGIAILSFHVWKFFGGNRPYNNECNSTQRSDLHYQL